METREFDLDKVLCDVWKAWKDDPRRSFTINSEQWRRWGIDKQMCKEAIHILIVQQLLVPTGPDGSNIPFPRLVALTEKGLAYCEQRCGS